MDIEECRDRILLNRYSDFIYEYNIDKQSIESQYGRFCAQFASNRYVCIYSDAELGPELSVDKYSYESIPKLYGLMDVNSVNDTGALQLQNLPGFSLKGRNVIVGFIDTGIDYTNRLFKTISGNTRIVSIWDQTDQNGTPPKELNYGSEYGEEEINRALRSEDPRKIVPHTDENGHGTFLAGVACGNEDVENSFIGAAPESMIAMVKLKEAKQYLRDFYLISSDAVAYQENDIMLGVKYLRDLAVKMDKPLVIVLGLGTSLGDHEGGAPLAKMLEYEGNIPGRCVVTCAGNEGNSRLHYRGQMTDESAYQDVEIRVGEGTGGFTLEIWGQTPDVYSISLVSPLGEVVPRIPARVGRGEVITFLLEDTQIYVNYRIVESGSGAELIFVRFRTPTPGIWKIRVFGSNILNGVFDMWMPIEQFTNDELYFVQSDPNVTITEPGNSQNIITVGAYGNVNDAIYAESGRGYTRADYVKPDLIAPGVDVMGPLPNRAGEQSDGVVYTRKSGTSISAALTAGVCAQFLEWGIVRGNEPSMKTVYIKNYLIRGAGRTKGTEYPNRQSGYGKVDAYEAFRVLTTT